MLIPAQSYPLLLWCVWVGQWTLQPGERIPGGQIASRRRKLKNFEMVPSHSNLSRKSVASLKTNERQKLLNNLQRSVATLNCGPSKAENFSTRHCILLPVVDESTSGWTFLGSFERQLRKMRKKCIFFEEKLWVGVDLKLAFLRQWTTISRQQGIIRVVAAVMAADAVTPEWR